mgnify:CR=1 FL=1
MEGKVILEEHFALEETWRDSVPDVLPREKIDDLRSRLFDFDTLVDEGATHRYCEACAADVEVRPSSAAVEAEGPGSGSAGSEPLHDRYSFIGGSRFRFRRSRGTTQGADVLSLR